MDLAIVPTLELIELGRTQARVGQIQDNILHELGVRWRYQGCPAHDKAVIREFDRDVVIPLMGYSRLPPEVVHLDGARTEAIPIYYMQKGRKATASPKVQSESSKVIATSAQRADFFISHCNKDASTVRFLRQWLQEAGYSTFVQDVDSAPSCHIIEKMEEGMRALRLLAVVSNNYIGSDYCRAEFQAALMRDPLNRHSRIVIVRIAPCELPDLWAPISRIELLEPGEQVRDIFLNAIAKLPNIRKPSRKKHSPHSPLTPVFDRPGLGISAQANGPGSIAAVVGRDVHLHYGAGKSPRGRPQPPPDVISEEQAVKLKQLMDEVIELDSCSPQGKKLTPGQLQQKWWGGLLKKVRASSYRNYSQARWKRAMEWARQHRARLIAGTAEEEHALSVMSMIRSIHTYISRNGLDKRECYRRWSERLNISPGFESSKDLSPKDLKRVYNAMLRDKKV